MKREPDGIVIIVQYFDDPPEYKPASYWRVVSLVIAMYAAVPLLPVVALYRWWKKPC